MKRTHVQIGGVALLLIAAGLFWNYTEAIKEKNRIESERIQLEQSLERERMQAELQLEKEKLEAENEQAEKDRAERQAAATRAERIRLEGLCEQENKAITADVEDFLNTCSRNIGVDACLESDAYVNLFMPKMMSISGLDWLERCVQNNGKPTR